MVGTARGVSLPRCTLYGAMDARAGQGGPAPQDAPYVRTEMRHPPDVAAPEAALP
jgi:hypothetical protein